MNKTSKYTPDRDDTDLTKYYLKHQQLKDLC